MQLPMMGRGGLARTHARALFSRLPWMRSMRLCPALPERLFTQQAAPNGPSSDRLSAAQLLYSVAAAPQHQLPGHVERPQRVTEVLAALRASGVAGSSKVQAQRKIAALIQHEHRLKGTPTVICSCWSSQGCSRHE